jgi:hypothetical protein
MEIEGYTADQIAAICEIWRLGKPIDIRAFLDRADIPAAAKDRVRKVAQFSGRNQSALVAAHRLMQAAIIREVVRIDRERWNPRGVPE